MLAVFSNLDRSLFLVLNKAFRNSVLDWLLPFISTNQLVWLVPGVILAIYLAMGSARTRWALAGIIMAAALSDSLGAYVIKPLFQRPRPFSELTGIFVYLQGWVPVESIKAGPTLSFPSGHAASSTAAAVVLGYFFPKARLVLIFLVLVVCYSRIYMGLHYPGDILGGMVLGLACAGAFFLFRQGLTKAFPRLFRPLTPEGAK
ncbi:MAG: phosphatase PAP2 family protein [Pseudomonadota bacterium]